MDDVSIKNGIRIPSCDDKNKTKPSWKEVLEDNVSELARAMGMDSECERGMRSSIQTAAVAGRIGMPFASAKFTANASNTNMSTNESGCGTFLLDSLDMLNSMKNMSCTLNANSSTQTVNTSSSVSVNISTSKDPAILGEHMSNLRNSFNRLSDTYDKASDEFVDAVKKNLPSANLALLDKAKEQAAELLKEAQHAQSSWGGIQMSDSNITSTTETEFKTINKTETQIVDKLIEDYKRMTKTVANSFLKRDLGAQAAQDKIQSAVVNKIREEQDNSKSLINSTLNQTDVKVNADSSVTIFAPLNITLERVNIVTGVQLNVVTSSLASQAADLGRKIANEILIEKSNDVVTDLKSAGVDDVQTATLEGIAKTTDKTLEDPSAQYIIYIVVGVVAVALIGVLGAVLTGKRTTKNSSETDGLLSNVSKADNNLDVLRKWTKR